MACPGGECTFKVDKTARGGAGYAALAKRQVGRCDHAEQAEPENHAPDGRALRAQRLLDRANQLLDHAGTLLDRLEDFQATEAALDEIARVVATAETNLAELEHQREFALEEAVEAETALDGATSFDVRSDLAAAEDATSSASTIASRIPVGQSEMREELREQLDAAEGRLAGTKDRLAALEAHQNE